VTATPPQAFQPQAAFPRLDNDLQHAFSRKPFPLFAACFWEDAMAKPVVRTRYRRLPDWATEARAAYLDGESPTSIGQRLGQHTSTLLYWIDRRKDDTGTLIHDPVPRQQPERTAERKPVSQADRRARLIARMWRALERQMQALEARLAELEPGGQPGESEAKTLGGLARLVKELSALDALKAMQATQAGGEDDAAATGVEALNRLRDALAQRLAGLDPTAAAGRAGPDDGG
jgi:hypothetical protein